MFTRQLSFEDLERANNALDVLTDVFGDGLHIGRNLLTVDQAMGFANDNIFMAAFAAASPTLPERSILWRCHTAAWAARRAMGLKGDFVDVGARQGFEAAVIGRMLNFAQTDRRWMLFDRYKIWRFEPFPGGELVEMDLTHIITDRVAFMPNATIVKADSVTELDAAPSQIAYLRIDEPDASEVTGVIAKLLPRLCFGGAVIVEGYGAMTDRIGSLDRYLNHIDQQILEMPTGQGLIIKR